MRPKDRLLWDIVAVLLFKAVFFYGIWACCFRQEQPARIAGLPALEDVRHGVDR